MLRRVSSFATGRRSKWLIIAAWVVVALALGPLQPKLQDATKNEPADFLPESADSTKVVEALKDFPGGEDVPTVIVYNRAGGLTAQDRRDIVADARTLSNPREIEGVQRPIVPFTPAGRPVPGAVQRGMIARDGSTAIVLIPLQSTDSQVIIDDVDRMREVVQSHPGLTAHVTGAAGVLADAVSAFEGIDGTLLIVTVLLVLFLLLAIYRSPVIAFVPLLVVGIAYVIAAALVYALVEAGIADVNGQTTGVLIVLMFGAGTDYCLLIVARYREELRRHDDKHAAMRHATDRTAPAILSSGGTVFLAMLVLALADLKSTKTMGPVLAIGIGVMVIAGLTLLPAVLSALGRRAFWPRIPQLAAEGAAVDEPSRLWRRIGHWVHDHPVFSIAGVVSVLLLGTLGNLQSTDALGFGQGFRNDPDSQQGQQLIQDTLPPGQLAPGQVVANRAVAPRVIAALEGRRELVTAAAVTGRSRADDLVLIDVFLRENPFSDAATNDVPALRRTVSAAAGGETALLGGTSAQNYDTNETLDSDASLIVPVILALIFVVLALLLRALVAPLYLMLTVVLSFGFALGASTLVFTEIMGMDAIDTTLPTFAFIFLVALGVDYNIFLIHRIKEESLKGDFKEGVIAGLERTGGVITSAGLILAGTFAALMSLPLDGLFQLGFTIALGVLVDTFLVRTILVPAIAFELGEWNWWPSRLARRAREMHERERTTTPA